MESFAQIYNFFWKRSYFEPNKEETKKPLDSLQFITHHPFA